MTKLLLSPLRKLELLPQSWRAGRTADRIEPI